MTVGASGFELSCMEEPKSQDKRDRVEIAGLSLYMLAALTDLMPRRAQASASAASLKVHSSLQSLRAACTEC